MRKALFAVFAVLSLSLLLPAGAGAQVARFEITPTVGYRFNGDLDVTDNGETLFDRNAEIEESAVYGVTVDVPLNQSWQLELLANRQDSSFIVDPGLFTPTQELGDVRLSYYHVGLLYQWGLGQVNPFFTFSGGLARIEPEFSQLEAENRFSASIAGGVKIFLSRNVGLRLEGRGYYTNLDTTLDDDDDRFRDRSDSDALYQGEASAGLIISF
ncbi:MAG TPA: outer membrane beta-barrel protein [Thermoanaerobaculia bacterium]|jgi:hypothetical protein|nr:outer membrane beta-barrel protein [Thermoanaerobaculia bacterium]